MRLIVAVSAILVGIMCLALLPTPARAFDPHEIVITVTPNPIPNGVVATVHIKIAGYITLDDYEAKYINVRVVDEDPWFNPDDLMGMVPFEPSDDAPWEQGEWVELEADILIYCEDGTIWGLESSGEGCADLALEIDKGRTTDKTNHYDTATKGPVSVCAEGNAGNEANAGSAATFPSIYVGIAVALGAGIVAYLIGRRLARQ